MKTIDECKEQVAKKHGWANWFEFYAMCDELNGLDAVVDEAMKLYAEQMCRRQRELCSESARYMNILGNVHINKTSILNAPLATDEQ